MARYFYRHFRVVDCSRHCGLPVATACFLLAAITGAMQIFSLYFIQVPWNYIMMGYGAGTLLAGLLAVLTGFRIFTVLYLLAESLAMIPVCIVIGYISFVLANFDPGCYPTSYPYYNSCYYFTSYEKWLYLLGDGLLWGGVIIACISIPFTVITLAGYRKLRLHQAGVNTAIQTGRRGLTPAEDCEAHHHHVVQPVVVAQQPAVITVPVAPPPVFVQTAPTVYPQLHQTGYIVQQNQPTVYIT